MTVVRSLSDLGGAFPAAAARWAAEARDEAAAAAIAACEHPAGRLAGSPGARRCGACGLPLSWGQVADMDFAAPAEPPRGPSAIPAGDLPPCPCGKRSYPSRVDAERQGEALRRALRGGASSAYSCNLGLPVWHLKSSGRSRRQRAGA